MLLGVIVIVLVVAAIVAAVISNQFVSAKPGVVSSGQYSQIPQSTAADGAPILGSPDAKVTLLEFADFSCPHCLEYQPTIQQVIDQLVKTGRARLIFRPMTFVGGPYSEAAAKAALCAGKRGKFWEMEAALFNVQATQSYQAFQVDTLKTTADKLGLDGVALVNCMSGSDVQNTLTSSAALFEQLGATGTPTVMYSTDGGVTFKAVIADAQGKPAGVPSYDQIAQVVSQADSQSAE
jgi:protein-disulfide isomerase